MGYNTNRDNVSLSLIGTRAPNTAPSVGSILLVPGANGGWDELVISVPAANVRNALGIDNGETAPSWKTTLDSTTPAAVDAAGSPGTSLIYPHRDHVHPQDPALLALDFLVGTATGELSAEIVVGTTPGGELGGTWGSPTVDTTHSGSAHHAAVTLAADADTLLSLSTQEIGLDTQTANTVLAGPATGVPADPTFRALVAADMPSGIVDLTAVDFLVGTATALLSGEIVAGTTPGGELGGTWASPTVDSTHSGSAHHNSLTIGADAEHTLATQVLSGVDASASQKGHSSYGAEFTVTAGAVVLATDGHGASKHTNRSRTVQMVKVDSSSPVWVDGSTTDKIYLGLVPVIYTSGDLSLKILRRANVATNTAVMTYEVYRLRDGAAAVTVTGTTSANFTPGDTNSHILSITVGAANFIAGDVIRLDFHRAGADGADTMTDNVNDDGEWMEFTADQ